MMSCENKNVNPRVSEAGKRPDAGADSGVRPRVTGGNNQEEKVKEKEGEKKGKALESQ